MLPGEADAAVDLDILRGDARIGLGAAGLGERGQDRQFFVARGGGPAGVVGGGLGRLHLEEHVGALVLDRLEAADGAAELDP